MAFKMMMIPVAYIVVLSLASNDAEAAIGINWGRQSTQRLVPAQAVDMLVQNGIKNARTFSAEEDILKAFSGSGIDLTVSINNATAFASIDDARSWVRNKAPYLSPARLRAVYCGGYVFHQGIQNKSYLHSAMESCQFLQNALDEAGHGAKIKTTFVHHRPELIRNFWKPSEAEFRDEIKEEMITTLRFLQQNNAPFVIDIMPLQDVTNNKFDPSFAFPDNQSTLYAKDINGAVYTNYFEYMYDSFVWALKKLNASDIKVIVGQVGWPTDGFPGANTTSAERFYKALLPLVASNKGTPMRPGAPIDVYIQSLTDEDQGPFTQHIGICTSNGKPKYKIDLSGQGRDIYPAESKGIMGTPQRWCMFNGNWADPELVKSQFDYACAGSDCTSLKPGGSCGKLSRDLNISYAFNMYFQFEYQDEKACSFSGLGYVSPRNPSTDECVFPVDRQQNFAKSGNPLRERPNYAISFVLFLVSILGTLFWN